MPTLIRGIFGGGGKIKDATALPEDVRKGKVFYNNEGRQVGSSDVIKVYSFNTESEFLAEKSSYSSINNYYVFKNGVFEFAGVNKNNERKQYYYTQSKEIRGVKNIIGITIDNKFFTFSNHDATLLIEDKTLYITVSCILMSGTLSIDYGVQTSAGFNKNIKIHYL